MYGNQNRPIVDDLLTVHFFSPAMRNRKRLSQSATFLKRCVVLVCNRRLVLETQREMMSEKQLRTVFLQRVPRTIGHMVHHGAISNTGF